MKNRTAWLVVALLWVVVMLNYLDRQVIFSLFPLLRKDLHLSDVELGLLGTAFLWVYAACSPLAGWIADRFGHRRVIFASLFVWSLVTGLTALAPNFPALIAARGLMGISEAFYVPAALALVASWHGEKTRSRAVGLHQSGIYAGVVLGGAGGAWVGEQYGWRTVFWALGAIGVFYACVLPFLLPSKPATQTARPVSPAGFWKSARTVAARPGFFPILAVFTTTSMAGWLIYTWMPLYLYEKFGLSLTQAGFTATFYSQAASVAGILLGGWLADALSQRFARGRIWTQVGGLCLGAPFLALTGVTSEIWVLYAALILYGAGRGIYDCNIMPVLCDVVGEDERSTGYGLLNCVGTLSGGVIAYAAGALKATVGIGGVLSAVGLLTLLSSLLLLLIPRRNRA
jgi:predicted MFS family arabinose efflux permease